MLGKLPPDAVEKDEGLRIAIARGFQEAAVAQLEEKVKLALRWCDKRGVKVNALVASGGVASNMYLRERYFGGHHCLLDDPGLTTLSFKLQIDTCATRKSRRPHTSDLPTTTSLYW